MTPLTLTAARVAVIRDRFDVLAPSGEGLTPAAIVADARSPDSPLHAEFDWNIEKAAQKHWEDRARELIQAVKVTTICGDETVVTQAWVHTPDIGSESGYVLTSKIKSEPERAKDVLLQEIARARGVLRRVRDLALALGLNDAHSENLLSELSVIESAVNLNDHV